MRVVEQIDSILESAGMKYWIRDPKPPRGEMIYYGPFDSRKDAEIFNAFFHPSPRENKKKRKMFVRAGVGGYDKGELEHLMSDPGASGYDSVSKASPEDFLKKYRAAGWLTETYPRLGIREYEKLASKFRTTDEFFSNWHTYIQGFLDRYK